MAIIHADGFDWYSDFNTYSNIYPAGSSAGDEAPVFTGRGGGRALRLITWGRGPAVTFAATPKVVTGFAMNMVEGYPSGTSRVVHFAGPDSNVGIQITATGYLQFLIGGSYVAQAPTVIPQYTWVYIEFKAIISQASGLLEVKIDGDSDPFFSYAGDTQSADNPTMTSCTIARLNGYGEDVWFDDWYILDASGSDAPWNDYLGDVSIRSLYPNGAGHYAVWNPYPAGPNWGNVDEDAASASDHNWSTNVGDRDSFTFSDLATATGTVYGVQRIAAAAKDLPGNREFHFLNRRISTSTDYVSSTSHVLSSSYLRYRELFPENPATSTLWTPSEVNDDWEFGYQLAGNKGFSVDARLET